jgi:hypothetical protein
MLPGADQHHQRPLEGKRGAIKVDVLPHWQHRPVGEVDLGMALTRKQASFTDQEPAELNRWATAAPAHIDDPPERFGLLKAQKGRAQSRHFGFARR